MANETKDRCYINIARSNKYRRFYKQPLYTAATSSEMDKMQVEEKKTNAACRPMVIGILFLILLLITIALTSVLVYRSVTSQLRAIKEPTLRDRFPGYFRYPKEQEAFEKLHRPSTAVKSFRNVTLSNTTRQCSAILASPGVPIYPARGIEYNSCCTTTTTFSSPEFLVDILGVNRTIAVFEDPEGKDAKQFIRIESCKQTNGCYFCSCRTKSAYVTLVWVEGSEYGVAWFKVDGCCKCFNS